MKLVVAGVAVGVAGGVVAAGSRLLCVITDVARCCGLEGAFGVVGVVGGVSWGPVWTCVRGVEVRMREMAGGGCGCLEKFLLERVGSEVWCTEE